MNLNKLMAKIVKINLSLHLDQSGKETFLMEWLTSPLSQPFLFSIMGVSILDMGQFTNYCQDTLVEGANLPTVNYKLRSHHNKFKVRATSYCRQAWSR